KEGNAVVDSLANRAARFLYVDVAIHRRTHLPGAKTNCRTDQVGIAETSLFHHFPPTIPENKPQSQANQAWTEAIVQRRGVEASILCRACVCRIDKFKALLVRFERRDTSFF